MKAPPPSVPKLKYFPPVSYEPAPEEYAIDLHAPLLSSQQRAAAANIDLPNLSERQEPTSRDLLKTLTEFNNLPANKVNTSIMTLQSLFHALLTVNYPNPTPTFLSTTVGGLSNGFYGIATIISGLSYFQRWSSETNQCMASAVDFLSIFSGITNFTYETCARIIGLDLPGDYGPAALESILMYFVSAFAPTLGLYMAYKSKNQPSRDQWDWTLYEVCKLLSLSFTAGSFVGSIESLFNLFGMTEEQSTKNLVILLTQLAILLIYIPLRYNGKQEFLKEFSKGLSSFNAILKVGGFLGTAIKTANPFAITLQVTSTAWYLGTYFVGSVTNLLNPFNYIKPAEERPLLRNSSPV